MDEPKVHIAVRPSTRIISREKGWWTYCSTWKGVDTPVNGWAFIGIDFTKVEIDPNLTFINCEFHHCVIPSWMKVDFMRCLVVG